MRVCILGSSSSGNATLFVSGSTRVLLDVGFSTKEITRRLKEVGQDISRLSAVVISHEHSDHFRGVPVLARTLRVPVFMSQSSFESWGQANPNERFEVAEFISAERPIEIKGFVFRPFTVPHDAADTFGFTVEANGSRAGYVTDLGYIPKMVSEHLRGADALILEANHDLEMLRNGPYPWAIKQRVMSRHGHLSNDEMARFLSEDFDGRAQLIVLAHLSRTNNHPEIARLAAIQALSSRSPLFADGVEKRVRLAYHNRPSEWIEL
jgi:phosphoribosyl 1,2-cyclic phosphodiesterase